MLINLVGHSFLGEEALFELYREVREEKYRNARKLE